MDSWLALYSLDPRTHVCQHRGGNPTYISRYATRPIRYVKKHNVTLSKSEG